MIVNPDAYIERFAQAGADIITVHYEACVHLHRTVQAIKAAGCKAGVAINPHTPVSVLTDILVDLDLVLIMSVNPGFGGQRFIQNTYKKISALKAMAMTIHPDLIIEVDGGVGLQNIGLLVEAGATAFVAGSAVFAAESPSKMIYDLKNVSTGTVNL